MRSPFIALTALACAAALAACGGGTTGTGSNPAGAKAPDKNATLTFIDAAPNANLDPADVSNDSSFAQATLYAVYDRLVGFDKLGAITPQLASAWKYSTDLKTLTLTLRSGATFQDGAAVDATAVKTNLERATKLTTSGATYKGGAKEIASVDAQDATTVVITLNKADGGFLYNLGTQLGMMISPASLDGSSGATLKPVGAGPFKVDSFQATNQTTFSRFDGYWGGPANRPAKFVVKYVVDATTRLNALRSGQASVSLITPAQVATAKSSGLDVAVNPTSSRWNIYLNTSRQLKDPRVRQALMYAIDRPTIAKALSFGTGEPTVQLIPTGLPGHVEGAESAYPYDPAKAKSLLAAAGLGSGLTLDYVLLNSPEYSQLTDVLTQEFKAVGVTLKVTTLDISQGGVFGEGKVGDMMLARWGGRADQLKTLNVVVGPGGTYAPGGVISVGLKDSLAKASDYSADDQQRDQFITEANKEVIDGAGTIPIMTRANIYASKPGCVTGLDQYLASGSNDWRDVTIGSGC